MGKNAQCCGYPASMLSMLDNCYLHQPTWLPSFDLISCVSSNHTVFAPISAAARYLTCVVAMHQARYKSTGSWELPLRERRTLAAAAELAMRGLESAP